MHMPVTSTRCREHWCIPCCSLEAFSLEFVHIHNSVVYDCRFGLTKNFCVAPPSELVSAPLDLLCLLYLRRWGMWVRRISYPSPLFGAKGTVPIPIGHTCVKFCQQFPVNITTSSPWMAWTLTLSWQYLAYKPSKLGQTDLVFGLRSEFTSRSVLAWLQVFTYTARLYLRYPGPKFTFHLRTILRQFSDLRQSYDNWRIHRTFTTVSRPILRHLMITFYMS